MPEPPAVVRCWAALGVSPLGITVAFQGDVGRGAKRAVEGDVGRNQVATADAAAGRGGRRGDAVGYRRVGPAGQEDFGEAEHRDPAACEPRAQSAQNPLVGRKIGRSGAGVDRADTGGRVRPGIARRFEAAGDDRPAAALAAASAVAAPPGSLPPAPPIAEPGLAKGTRRSWPYSTQAP